MLKSKHETSLSRSNDWLGPEGPPKPSVNLKSALAYIKCGFEVVPLFSRKKGRCGCGDLSCKQARHQIALPTNEATVAQAYWIDHPFAPVGIMLGGSANLVALCVTKKGAQALNKRTKAHGKFKRTVKLMDRKRSYRLFFADATSAARRTKKLAKGVTLLGQGEIVVFPAHRFGRKATSYRRFGKNAAPNLVQVAPLPKWLAAIPLAPSAERTRDISVDQILVDLILPPRAPEVVESLIFSMRQLGLVSPIGVRAVSEGFKLIYGRHRLEAAKRLGWKTIQCTVLSKGSENDRLSAITENLHRAELTALERAEQLCEWADAFPAEHNVASSRRGGRPKGLHQQLLKQLPIVAKSADALRKKLSRAREVNNIAPEVKVAARKCGLDNNQSALRKVASHNNAADQMTCLEDLRDGVSRKRNKKSRIRVKAGVGLHDSSWQPNERPGDSARRHPILDIPDRNERAFALLMEAWRAAPAKVQNRFRQELLKTRDELKA